MARLVSPNGVVVDVSDEKAKRLLDQDYAAEKAPAKKAASSKSEK